MAQKYLEKFFVVTTTSLYRVEYVKNEAVPVVEKIAKAGDSDVAVGSCLTGGYNVGITNKGLVVYGSNRELPEFVNTRSWGGTTSQIVALFLKEGPARECLESGDLTPLNPKWQAETEAVLAAIGTNHPKFLHSQMDAIRY